MVEGRRISFPSRGALKIAVPVSLTILLYTLSLFFVVLPAFEGSILERKRENVRHLTQTAWSVLVHLERRAAAGDLTREAAQAQAVAMLRDVRFGPEGKDYFWVNDMHPRMVVHPYRPDLEGHDISDFADPNGERLFVRFVEMVRREGEGWVPYLWQWKDDPARVVPKISYVKGFAPWAWVVGSGLYLDDVREEIAAAARRLTWLSFAIVALTGLLSGFVIWQGARFERRAASRPTRCAGSTRSSRSAWPVERGRLTTPIGSSRHTTTRSPTICAAPCTRFSATPPSCRRTTNAVWTSRPGTTCTASTAQRAA